MPENTSRSRSTRAWLYLLLLTVGAVVLLSACGGNTTPSANAATTPAAIATTPATAATTPTPTPAVAPTLTKGSQLVVMIVDGSNGSFGFNPTALAVAIGTTVIWKNMSSAPHTVTSDDGQTFDSGNIPVGGTFRFKFTTAGMFAYHCNIHPYMRATIYIQ